MSDTKSGFGTGLLKGLKNLLFHPDPEDATAPVITEPRPVTATPKTVAPAIAPIIATPSPSLSGDEIKDMQLKVYQLLESMNQPGCDFFEVWNAAVEMGGANSANIKAAFTSLRFADNTLSKAKLLETGNYYKTNLQTVIDTEIQKRQQDKTGLIQQKEQQKSGLSNDIASLEQQLLALQQQLANKKADYNSIEAKYEPDIAEIDKKIALGQQSVSRVVADMQQVLDIIQKELN
jgi:hypothetical protein